MHRKKASQSGVGAPTVTPEFVGQIFYDTTNQKTYVGIGISSSADWLLLAYDIPGSGGNGLRLIVDYTVTVSAENELIFTNLDINTHQMYLILAKIINPTTAKGYMRMFINNDYTLSNYISSTGSNKSDVFRIDETGDVYATIYLSRFEDDTASANSVYVRKSGNDGNIGWWHDNTTTPDINITSITFSYQDTTNVLGVDSNISIFGVL